jgi:hypothetical protein
MRFFSFRGGRLARGGEVFDENGNRLMALRNAPQNAD